MLNLVGTRGLDQWDDRRVAVDPANRETRLRRECYSLSLSRVAV